MDPILSKGPSPRPSRTVSHAVYFFTSLDQKSWDSAIWVGLSAYFSFRMRCELWNICQYNIFDEWCLKLFLTYCDLWELRICSKISKLIFHKDSNEIGTSETSVPPLFPISLSFPGFSLVFLNYRLPYRADGNSLGLPELESKLH